MLKTSITESVEPKKSVVKVGGGGRNIAEPIDKHKVDGSGRSSGDSDKKCSLDAPQCILPRYVPRFL